MRIAKYLLLIVPALLALYVIAPYGDRCNGLAHYLLWVLLVGIYAVVLLIQTGVDLYQLISNKRRFDFFPLCITCIAAMAYIAISPSECAKPWAAIVFDGRINYENLQDAGLTLYANGSFDAYSGHVESICTYVGTYKWQSDTLLLLRADLTRLTDSTFATTYYLRLPDSTLIPIEEGFKPIQRLVKNS